MPKAIVPNASLPGKTIAKVADEWHVNGYWRIFLFTDGSFYATDNKNEPIFGIDHRKDVDVNEAAIAKRVRQMAVDVGLLSQQTYDTQVELENAQRVQQNEDADRQTYEKLKLRFEGKDKDADAGKNDRRSSAGRAHRTRTA